MKIASATGRHRAAIAELMAASPLLRRYGVTARSARASVAAALRERDVVVIALDGQEVVGLAWLITTRALDHAAYLRLLLVAESVRSRGVGGALLARAEKAARAARCRHLALLVTKTNGRARAFYERHGYRHVGDLRGFVRPRIDEAFYVKSW